MKLSDKSRNRIIAAIEWAYVVTLLFFIAMNGAIGNYTMMASDVCLLVWVAIAMGYRRERNKLSEILSDTFKNTDSLFGHFKVVVEDTVRLFCRVEGLVKAVRRAAAARKADREKLRRIVEVANAIDMEMTPNDSFNQEKIRWASAIRNIVYGRTANV